MILCQKAAQNIHLAYSVIKFLRFERFVWEGASLPFVTHRLGELVQAEITLINQKGKRQSRLRWDQGQIYGPFRGDEVYDLTLRLEYRAPFSLTEIRDDFGSIHPNSYEISVDFLKDHLSGSKPIIGLIYGSTMKHYPLRNCNETLPDGQEIDIQCRDDHVGFSIKHSCAVPYGHRHFPKIRLGP